MAYKKKKKKKEKTEIFILFALFAFVVFIFFINFNIWEKRKEIKDHIAKTKEDLERVSLEKEYMDAMLKKESGDIEEEMERIAREQLLLKREGEKVIVISREKEEEKKNDEEKDEGGESFFQKVTNFFRGE